MKRSTLFIASTSILLLASVQVPARGVTIDLFNDVDNDIDGVQFIQDSTANGISVTDIDGATIPLTGVIGGTRTLTVNKLTGSPDKRSLLGVDSSTNSLDFSSDNKSTGSFSAEWNGDFDGSGSNNYLDLTEGGAKNSFLISILTNDLGVKLNFEVSDGTNVAQFSPTLAKAETGDIHFYFAKFTNPTVLTQARSIKLYSSNEPAGLDLSMARFETVPFEFSPSLGIILFGSFLGFCATKKRLANT